MVDFLVIGYVVAVHYDDVFPLIKDNRVFLGYSVRSGYRFFQVPYSYDLYRKISFEKEGIKYIAMGIRWFTSFEMKDEKPIVLKEFDEDYYRRYDNYDYLNVDDVRKIPDYEGVMGVPITFIDKWCREQFDIVGIANVGSGGLDLFAPIVDGVSKFIRILIKKKITH